LKRSGVQKPIDYLEDEGLAALFSSIDRSHPKERHDHALLVSCSTQEPVCRMHSTSALAISNSVVHTRCAWQVREDWATPA
jgi:hypothetical protein